MTTFTFEGPGGKTITLEGPEGATREQAAELLKSHLASQPDPSAATAKAAGLSRAAQAYRIPGMEGAPGRSEQFLGGAKHSLDRAALGLEGMVKGAASMLPGVNLEPSPENVENVKRGEQFVKDTGWLSTAGQIGGDVLMTAAPVNRVASVLTNAAKAVPYVKALGRAIPAIADVGASAGVSAALAPENRGEAAAFGGAGSVLGQAVGQLWKQGRKVWDKVIPEITNSADSVATRAARTIGREVDPKELARIKSVVDQGGASPSALPRTTAAMSRSESMGRIERGARVRNPGLFSKGTKDTQDIAWKAVNEATPNADATLTVKAQADAIMDEARSGLDKLKLTLKDKEDLSQRLLQLRNHPEVLGAKDANRTIDELIGLVAKEGPVSDKVTAGTLSRMRDDISQIEPFRGQRELKDVLDNFMNVKSKDNWGEALDDFKGVKEDLKRVQAHQSIRQKFDVEGTPTTKEYIGDSGVDAIPEITSHRLRKALASELKKDADELKYLDPEDIKKMNMLADQLRDTEIWKAGQSPGKTTLDTGGAESAATAILNTGPFWRLRGTLAAPFKHLTKATEREVDKAAADPREFVRIMDKAKADKIAARLRNMKNTERVRNLGRAGGAMGYTGSEE